VGKMRALEARPHFRDRQHFGRDSENYTDEGASVRLSFGYSCECFPRTTGLAPLLLPSFAQTAEQ
jgi:hypothetical protein